MIILTPPAGRTGLTLILDAAAPPVVAAAESLAFAVWLAFAVPLALVVSLAFAVCLADFAVEAGEAVFVAAAAEVFAAADLVAEVVSVYVVNSLLYRFPSSWMGEIIDGPYHSFDYPAA